MLKVFDSMTRVTQVTRFWSQHFTAPMLCIYCTALEPISPRMPDVGRDGGGVWGGVPPHLLGVLYDTTKHQNRQKKSAWIRAWFGLAYWYNDWYNRAVPDNITFTLYLLTYSLSLNHWLHIWTQNQLNDIMYILYWLLLLTDISWITNLFVYS